ncbi:uncharacterized protein K489DRAFT_379409 [Dissoconium aciculare CBS 342.82]|uniref:Uncharacterized protein n=1 Tax=Dissoconium aciculare CBS 342.82 TaxID=1314786 RepID=A0A6J3M687_9PEZI|nr:uncharacterized protein K489DRAFT_379409 [Dissoconium aciculare CBS 342.82]KAF1823413.1 hypothetical protein K489DRAFT_379409 [Dissoconium aciculare CBS 342.82]
MEYIGRTCLVLSRSPSLSRGFGVVIATAQSWGLWVGMQMGGLSSARGFGGRGGRVTVLYV